MPIYIVITKGRESYFVYRVEANFGKAEEVLKEYNALLVTEEVIQVLHVSDTCEQNTVGREPRLISSMELR